VLTLAQDVPAARFAALPDHRPVSFGRGSLHVELVDGKHAWLIPLGPEATADLLAEMIAALVYHYEPDPVGGSAITGGATRAIRSEGPSEPWLPSDSGVSSRPMRCGARSRLIGTLHPS